MRPAGMVLGAQKAGTTALYEYLAKHPGIVPSKRKEMHFFNNDRSYARGEKHYLADFELNTPWRRNKITLDVSPGYLLPAEKTAERIFRFDPALKLMATLRDPVARAYSAWQMYRKFYKKDKDWFFKWNEGYTDEDQSRVYVRRESFGDSFLADIEFEFTWKNKGRQVEMLLIDHGYYADQLAVFLEFFPREQLLIIINEEMRRDTASILAQIESHLGLSHHQWHSNDLAPHFEGKYNEKPDAAAVALLREHFQPHNEKLFSLIGRRLDWQ